MTALERAALAVKEQLCLPGEGIIQGGVASDTDMRDIARAVLTAIREPSEGMQAAGYGECHHPKDIPEHIWQAMIDAALNEQ